MSLHAAIAVISLVVPMQSHAPECHAWQECRQLAEEAAARHEFEIFHDLAWRTVQTGPRNDSALMHLLARAQSLSGRPGDAVVMLRRLIERGVEVDVSTDDFRRVRELPQWPEIAESFRLTSLRQAYGGPPELQRRRKAEATGAGVKTGASESLRFTTPQFTPAGLAYDAVSRRFVVGDRYARKLAVVDEFSHHVANLAGAQTSGFGEIAALEIDLHEGNLWVVSSEAARTTLHKLQLVSGRLLSSYPVPESFAPVSFADVAITPASTVLALDRAGHRLFRLRPRAASTELALSLPDSTPTSIAPADDAVAYVAHGAGIWRVDLASRATTPVKAGSRADVSGLARIRWHRGSLVGIQRDAEGGYRAVRIRLDGSGRRAVGIDVLDPRLATTDPTGATVVNGILYYLASGEGPEMIVRQIVLR